MEFKEVEIIKNCIFCGLRYITTYHDYFDDDEDMIKKFTSFPPRKGDVIRVTNKITHQDEFLQVKYISIDYVENRMTIWCK